jgi:hypothetical protein
MCAVVPRYLECAVYWDCYSSSVKIRCQATDSEDCSRLRALVFEAVSCKVRRLAVVLYYLELRVECIGAINPNIQSKPRLIVTWQYVCVIESCARISFHSVYRRAVRCIGKDLKGSGLGNFEVLCWHFSRRDWGKKSKLSRDSRWRGRDLNRAPADASLERCSCTSLFGVFIYVWNNIFMV